MNTIIQTDDNEFARYLASYIWGYIEVKDIIDEDELYSVIKEFMETVP